MLEAPTWGMDVPSCRLWGSRPTCGALMLCFFCQSTTRSSYVMHFSQRSLRGADIWHIGQQPQVIECCWQIMKLIFQNRSMQLRGDGLYTALLITVFAYLLVLRVQAQGVFSKLTLTESMRQVRREEDVRDCLVTHFHTPFSIAYGI